MEKTLLVMAEGVLKLQIDELVRFESRGLRVENSVHGTGNASALFKREFLYAAAAEGVSAVGQQNGDALAQVEPLRANLTVHYWIKDFNLNNFLHD